MACTGYGPAASSPTAGPRALPCSCLHRKQALEFPPRINFRGGRDQGVSDETQIPADGIKPMVYVNPSVLQETGAAEILGPECGHDAGGEKGVQVRILILRCLISRWRSEERRVGK